MGQMGNKTRLLFNPFVLETPNQSFKRSTEKIVLRPKTFAVLDFPVRNPHRLVTKTDAAEKPSVHPSSASGRTGDRSKSLGIFSVHAEPRRSILRVLQRIEDRDQTSPIPDPGIGGL
jgi:hypothetical protein